MNRLDRLRGTAPAKRHNARTIAALTGNPGCARRAVLDAAGVDKPRLAERIGFPGSFGQSRFALARGNAFEAMLKADNCALLRETLSAGEITYRDLATPSGPLPNLSDLPDQITHPDLASGPSPALSGFPVKADDSLDARNMRTREVLVDGRPGLFDHPLLTLDVAGQTVYLEPDLIAFQREGRLQVVEIKSFAIVDGQADSAKVSAAAVQAAVYVLALRRLLGEDRVSHEAVLVCPENFSLRPVAVVLDVRKQLATLRRQLSRLSSVSSLIESLPAYVSFDPAQPVSALLSSLATVPARYAPECLSSCEMSVYCRHEASGATAALGRSVRESLGGIETVEHALDLASGAAEPTEDEAEAATLLKAAARLRAEALS